MPISGMLVAKWRPLTEAITERRVENGPGPQLTAQKERDVKVTLFSGQELVKEWYKQLTGMALVFMDGIMEGIVDEKRHFKNFVGVLDCYI